MNTKQNNNTQSGRSMVEMLGVLAIIGVLSVGGIAGYQAAMDQKIINDILETFNIATTELRAIREGVEATDGIIILPRTKYGKYYATMGISTTSTETENAYNFGPGDFNVGLRTTAEGDTHIPVRKGLCKKLIAAARSHPLTGRINTTTGYAADLAIGFVLSNNRAQFAIDKESPIKDECTETGYWRYNCCPAEDFFVSGMYGNLDQN